MSSVFGSALMGGGGSGGTLVCTAPAGVTVTAANEALGKTYTKVADAKGVATFKGLATGTWLLSISDGVEETAPVPVVITADYTQILAFFAAYIHVTYPPGSTCKCSKGGVTITAPDTSGSVTFNVPSAGVWTVTSTANDGSGDEASKTVEITAEGQSERVSLSYAFELFNGGDNTQVTGGWASAAAIRGNVNEYSVGDTIKWAVNSYNGGVVTPNLFTLLVFPANKQDLSEYTKLRVTIKTAVVGCIAVFSTKYSDDHQKYYDTLRSEFAAYENFTPNSAPAEIELDISSFTESYYVGILTQGANTTSGEDATVEVSKVELV